MRKIISSAFILSLVAAPAVAAEVSVKIINKSNFEIHEMYVGPTKQNHWGEDQLRDDVIEKNSSFELRKIPVGKYDFKIVDEDGDECVVADVKVVADEEVVFNDELLVGCQAATEAAAEEEEEE